MQESITDDGSSEPKVITSSSKSIEAEAKVSHTNADGETHTKGKKYDFKETSVPVGDGSEPNKVDSNESKVSYEIKPKVQIKDSSEEKGQASFAPVTITIPIQKD